MFHSAQGNETTMTGQETLLSRICAGGIVENPRLPLPELEYTPKLCKTVPSNIAMDCSYGSYGVFISTHVALFSFPSRPARLGSAGCTQQDPLEDDGALWLAPFGGGEVWCEHGNLRWAKRRR